MAEKLPRRYYVTTTQDTGFPVSASGALIYVSPLGPGPTDLVTAKEQARAGDTIIVLPGDYTITTDQQLFKHLVHWHFMPGAKITPVCLTSGSGYAIFDDRATGAVTCVVTGALDVVFACVNPFNPPLRAAAFYTEDPNTILYFEANSISVTDPTLNGQFAAFKNKNCNRCIAHINDVFDPHMDGTSDVIGAYWNQGTVHYHVERNVVSGLAIDFQPTETSASEGFYTGQFVQGGLAGSLVPHAVWLSGGDGAVNGPNYRAWIDVNEIAAPSGSAVHIVGNAGKMYVNAQKIGTSGTSAVSAVIHCGASASGVNAWIRAEKITGFNQPAIQLGAAYTGTAKISFQEIEDASAMPSAINVAGGTLHANGPGVIKILNGKGVVHSGGTTFVRGCRIDTSATNNAANRPVEISAAGLTINGCSLIAPAAADSAYAGSALVLKSIGSVANRAKNVNVTVNDNTVEQIAVWSGYA